LLKLKLEEDPLASWLDQQQNSKFDN